MHDETIIINGKKSKYTWSISNHDETRLYLFDSDMSTKDIYRLYIVFKPRDSMRQFQFQLRNRKGEIEYVSSR